MSNYINELQEIDNRIKAIEDNICETIKKISIPQNLQDLKLEDFIKQMNLYRDVSTWQCETDALRNTKLRLINSVNLLSKSQDGEPSSDYVEE